MHPVVWVDQRHDQFIGLYKLPFMTKYLYLIDTRAQLILLPVTGENRREGSVTPHSV